MQLNNKAKFGDKHLEFRAQLATVHRATAAVYLANLFPFRLVELGELVPVAVDLVERGRVFWQRWRWNWPGRYRGLFVRFVATVNTGRMGAITPPPGVGVPETGPEPPPPSGFDG